MSQFFKQNKLQTALKLCYILDLPGFYFFRGVKKKDLIIFPNIVYLIFYVKI